MQCAITSNEKHKKSIFHLKSVWRKVFVENFFFKALIRSRRFSSEIRSLKLCMNVNLFSISLFSFFASAAFAFSTLFFAFFSENEWMHEIYGAYQNGFPERIISLFSRNCFWCRLILIEQNRAGKSLITCRAINCGIELFLTVKWRVASKFFSISFTCKKQWQHKHWVFHTRLVMPQRQTQLNLY